MTQFVRPNEFAKAFLETIKRTDKSELGLEGNGPLQLGELPSEALLTRLIGEAWKASLETEEGRPTRFNVVFPLGRPCEYESFSFQSTRRYSSSELVRLAPAVGTQMRRLVVVSNESELEIAGIEDEWLHSPIGHTTKLTTGFTLIVSGQLELSVLGPSKLRLMYGPIGLEYNKGVIREFVSLFGIEEFIQLLRRLVGSAGGTRAKSSFAKAFSYTGLDCSGRSEMPGTGVRFLSSQPTRTWKNPLLLSIRFDR